MPLFRFYLIWFAFFGSIVPLITPWDGQSTPPEKSYQKGQKNESTKNVNHQKLIVFEGFRPNGHRNRNIREISV